jgi:hypothetical protein
VPAQYRALEPPPHTGAINTYDAEYEITYLDARLVSVLFDISTYTGGAHPNSEGKSLMFDLAQRRVLRLTDLLADPKRGEAVIAQQCKAQLEADAAASNWRLFEHADIGAVVRNAKNWSVDEDGATVMFNRYAVAPGAHDCRLAYAELTPLLKPRAPLPRR